MVSPQPGIVKDGVSSKRYPVPGIPRNQPQRTAGIGHFDTGIFRSVRTGRGRRYDNDSLNIRKSILEEIERDGLSIVEIVICYRRLHINVIYAGNQWLWPGLRGGKFPCDADGRPFNRTMLHNVTRSPAPAASNDHAEMYQYA